MGKRKKYTLEEFRRTALSVRNWGRWGKDDEMGTLNYVTNQSVVEASKEVKEGRVFSLSLNFGPSGPQRGGFGGRFNPIHLMTASGADVISGAQSRLMKRTYQKDISYADDIIIMPLQCATQWDALSHIFFEGKMWNGYDASLVNSSGALKNDIAKVKDKVVGRGVLLDFPSFKGVE
ncbi:cyclase family protein [Sulfolobus acidocaldarius]|nr:hypothetical protein SacN8_09005 [Sulfolobus acidocaldarius N8]AGE74034.1 hypothetical protein SacRon12I_09025 [Sulfolobus acidocaldarius Ron12/I]ALU30037.1 hypothetical protein ATY89_08895 [Sulfolobus acidocaldarius]ALU30727.1 hypothetical protein ATZ20_00305 [Sulfolobus acidocaldarius]